jgi:hypothetical protein
LDDLLAQESVDGQDAPGRTSPYKLTLMKKLSQSTKPSKIKERVADLDLVKRLHLQLSRALRALALKPEGIRYYADNVIRSKVFQLIRRNDPDRYLHLLAFIAHQYYRSRITWSTHCLPACGAFRMVPSTSTRSSVTPGASSATNR